jgi:hypothetical protein
MRLNWTRRSNTFGRNGKDLVDPYTLLLECRLDDIRPSLGSVLNFDNPYEYTKVGNNEQFRDLRGQFIDGPCLQLVSQRSRPEAFLTPDTTADPDISDPGIVDIKVVKIGILFRREMKRILYSKPTWKEWGAILTASQLYLFKDVSWIKASVLSQTGNAHENKSDVSLSSINAKSGTGIIRVPIDGFHPNSVLSTVDMIALIASSSSALADNNSQQKNSFLLAGRSGTQDWFSATSEDDMKDWILKINFAAAFNTYHISIHGDKVGMDRIVRPRKLKSLRKSNSDSSLSTNKSDSQPINLLSSSPPGSSSSALPSSSSNAYVTTHQQQQYYKRLKQQEQRQLFQEAHNIRSVLLDQKLLEIEAKIETKLEQIEENIRAGKHLKLLAPLLPRTRESIIFASGRLQAKLDWQCLDYKRLICYQEMFAMEKQLEIDDTISMSVFSGSTAGSLKSRKVSAVSSQDSIKQESIIISRTGSPVSILSGESTRNAADGSSLLSEMLNGTSISEPVEQPRIETINDGIANEAELSAVYNDRLNSSSQSPPPLRSQLSTGLSSPDATADTPVKNNRIKKTFPESLRDKGRPKPRKPDTSQPEDEVKRSPSLMRKEQGDFTLLGKKFSVVEVNPEFAATPNHHRTTSFGNAGAGLNIAIGKNQINTPDLTADEKEEGEKD